MNIEQARKLITDCITEREYTYTIDELIPEYIKAKTGCYVSFTAKDVIRRCSKAFQLLALFALRAQQERENGCEYCDFSSGATGACISNVGDNFILIQSENGVSIATDDSHFKMLNIAFCPICGRKLDHEQKEA